MAQISTTSEESFVESRKFYRSLEIIPGALTWFILLSPIIFSVFWPLGVAYFIIAFDLYWLLKSIRMSLALIMGHRKLKETEAIDWRSRAKDLENLDKAILRVQKELEASKKSSHVKKAYYQELRLLREHPTLLLDPRDIVQCVIMPVYNESLEIVRPSIETILQSEFNTKNILFVLAYEERGGESTRDLAKQLHSEYKNSFMHYMSVEHPDGIVGEIKGKGPNISYAGRKVLEYVKSEKIDINNVVITTLDCDNKVHPHYFSRLSFAYCANPNRLHTSFQPLALYFNNIWDVPAPMRVIASGNSTWPLIESVRQNRLRNFASHAQGLASLVDTDFWSLTSPVEDGHQYYRTYFTYNGDHMVEPLFLPIYQDAVLSSTYHRTFQSQFKQLQRWAYGASDFPYVVKNSITHTQIALGSKLTQIGRLLENHISWSTAPLIITFAAWAPLYLNSDSSRLVIAHQLPIMASRILTLATVGMIVTIWISLIMMPRRPKHQPKWKSVAVLLQWILVPVTAIVFGSFAAISAQTRLMFGRYLGFTVTEKAVKK